MLCASSSGRLQLLDLQHQEHPNMRSLPMLPPARPVHLTVHPSKAVLVVACQGSDKLWEMRCMHPATGALSSSLIMPYHLSSSLIISSPLSSSFLIFIISYHLSSCHNSPPCHFLSKASVIIIFPPLIISHRLSLSLIISSSPSFIIAASSPS